MRRAVRTVVAISALIGAGCGSEKVSSVEVTSVTLRPASATLIVGESRRFTADIRDQDGNSVPSTIVTWSASPGSVVTVDESGLVQAVGAGAGTVRATAQGVSGSASITVEPPPTIALSAASASLAGLLGGTPPPEPVQLQVTNSGSGTLSGLVASVTYPPGSPTGWLSPSLSGTTAPTTLTLSAVTSGLEIGDYQATVALSSGVAANTPQAISVTLRVVADQPVIDATPALVGFSAVSGGQRPPEQIVTIENIGGGDLDDMQVGIVYEGFGDWMTATLSGPTAPAELRLEVDPVPLPPGSYEARARLTSAKALNSPKDVVVSFNVEGRADLRVTKLGPDSLPAGTRVAYGLEIRNGGPSAAEGVVFTDTLPANATLVAVPAGATLSGRVLQWDLGTLQNGDQRSFTVEMDVPSDGLGLLRNVAAAASPTPDPAIESRVARISTRVLRVNDLDVRKTGPDSAFAGQTATYDLVIVNRGPSDAVSVVVSDSLPTSVTFVPGSDGAAEVGGVVTWPVVPSLAVGDSVVLQATIQLPSDRTGILLNTARVGAATRDPVVSNDTARTATPVVVYADLEAIARAPAQDTAGTPMTLQAGVRNLGPANASSVVVSDTLPAGLTFVSATGGGMEAGGVVTWPAIPTLTPGDSAIYDVVVDVGTGVGASLTHRVGVTSTTLDPGPSANADSATTTVFQLADLHVAKTGPPVDTAGTVASWTIVVRNDGPSDATGVVVVDSLPPGSTAVVASDGGVEAAGVVTWPTVGTLLVGDSIVRTVQAVLDPAATGSTTNVARATSTTTDPDTVDNRSAVVTALSTSADLGIAKAGPASAVAGDTLVYTLTISNAGPSTATSVVVTDTLPAGTSFVRASTGGSASGGVVTWTGGTVAPGATAQVTVTARVNAGRTADITNVATVGSAVADPVATDNRDTLTSTVQVAADVAVTKTGPASVTAGSAVSWTVQVVNNGPSTARNVVLTDTLPAGVSFVSATGGGSHAAGVVTWPTVTTLAPGASSSFTVNGTVSSAATGTITNVAAATATSPDPAAADNRATSASTVASSADLSVTKTGAAADTAGTAISWTVQATNAGPSDAAGVVVSDTLPAGFTFVSATGGGVYSAPTNTVTWTVGALANGASTPVYTVNATIPTTATGSATNRARVAATTADPAAANDRDAVTTTIAASADLSVTKTGAATDTAGTAIAWTVQASNAGPSDATGVVVSDTLPAGFTFVSATGGGVYSAPTNTVTWTVGSLANGASTPVFSVNATIPTTATGSITNRARVAATTADPAAANDRDAVTTTIAASADLSVTKTGAAVDTAGTAISWTVRATNAGPSDATGVVVSDTLPTGFTFVSATGGGVYSAPTNTVTWAVGALANGASTPVFTVTATIPPTASGSATNRARVTAATADPATANDRDAVTTTIAAAADLSVTKTGAAVDTAGTAIAWTVRATNAGPSDAAGVVVSDTLPAGFTFVSATGGGVYSAPTNTVTWTVGALAAGTSTPLFTVNATIPGTASGGVTNRARVAAATADPVAANDRDAVTTTIAAAADLSVTKTGAAVDTAGTAISWTVQATNAGPSDATAVVVSDTLPAGFTFVSASGGGVYSATTNTVTWSVGTLANGASTPVFTVAATIPATASGAVTNRARVASTTADPAAANDRDAVTTTVVAAADLSVTKTGAAVDTAGTATSWTVQATNAGPSAAAGVVVSDTLPTGFTFVSATGGGVYSAPTNTVTWTVGALANGASTPVYTVNATIPSTASGPATNRARVASATADPTAANDRDAVTTTVVAAADLSVTKTGAAVDTAGTAISWTVQATNAGPSAAAGVVVSDTLPTGFTFVSATGGGVYSAPTNTVTWTVGTLADGASTPVYTVNATIPTTATGPATNRARVAATTGDPAPANDRDAVTTTVVAAADLSVTKTGAAIDTAGTAIAWTVQATNSGPSDAAGVVVSDTLPAGFTFVSATGGGVYSAPTHTVTWTVGALADGASTPVFTVNATVPPTASGAVTNRARVAATTGDPAAANDRDAVTTTIVASADLSVTKTGAAVDTAGTAISWTVQATNAGPSDATGVVVSDTLPSGFTFVSATGGGVYSAPTNTVTWSVGALANGASTPVYTVNASIPSTASGAATNRARVAAATADPTPANDRDAVTTTVVAAADLSVTKTGAAVDTAGTATSWTVQATNAGPSDATGVVVSDTLPTGFTFVSATGGGVYSAPTNTVTWTVGALANGASTPIYTVNATIPSTATGTATNRARVAATTADPTAANDRDAVTTTIAAAADLSVTKTGAAVDTAGTAISWTVQATNAGPSAAAGVVVSDTLPAGFTFVSATGGGVYSAPSNTVTWTVGALADGASTPVYTVNATIPSTATGSATNRARVAATTADPAAANDRDAVTTSIATAADLSVTKTGAAVDTAGTSISWTVQATNAGPSDAAGVVVSDTLPAGFTFVSATGGGVYSAPTNTVTWTVGALADGASTPVYTVNATIPATASGAATNRARVAATTGDPAAANDRDAVTTTVVAAADLSVTKTGAAVDTAGTATSWTVQATNAGPSDATGVVVSDTLPTGFTFVSATGGGVYSAPTNTVTWTVGALANGASTPIYTVNATIPSTATGSATNRARVAATSADPAAANDRDAVTTSIVAAADLSVAKTGPAVDTAGTATSWTVQATNAGPSDAAGVVVSDTLPAGFTFVSATGGGVYSAPTNTVTWTVGALADGASTPIYTVNATIPSTATGTATNRARVAATTADPTAANDRDAVTTTVATAADLSVAKTGPAVDTAGTATSWTVQATNAGPSDAAGVIVSDTLPTGFTFVSATGGGVYSAPTHTVTWTIGALADGASTPIYTVNATIPSTASGTATNRARVAATTADPTPANDRDAVTTTVAAAADLSVTKTGPGSGTAGAPIAWTVQATNAGPSDAAGVVVSDTLPPGFTFVSATGGGVYSAPTNTVTWTVGALANGASTPIYTVNATIPATATGSATNRARVAATTADPAPANDRDAVTTTIGASADLSVAKTGPAVDTAGTATSWTVQATNAGPSDAVGVVVSDTLPTGFTFVSATGGGVYSAPTHTVTWTVGALANGASTPIYTVDATIPSSATGSATNRARVAATTGDPAAANDRDAVTTTIAAAADLSVAKTGPAVDTAGTATSWTVQATNAGPSDAAGVVVSDTLPTGFTFVSATGGGVYSAPTHTVTWTVGTLADGASTPIYTVDATIPSTATGSATNRARVAATTGDPASANDRDAVTTTVATAADLVAGASGPATAAPSTQITFTVSVTNVGPSTATGVVVTDTLPAGVTFVSATGGGVFAAGVVTWPTIASIAPGAPATTFDVVVDVDAGTSGAITNIVGAAGSDADPLPGNNRATSVTTVSAPSPQPSPSPDPAPADAPVAAPSPTEDSPRLRSP